MHSADALIDIHERTHRSLHGAPDHRATFPVEDLVPAHVPLRTQPHAFRHHGEIASTCRLLGHGFPRGLDFPLRSA